jgi:hypothetical protein
MEGLSRSIRYLESLLVPGIGLQEYKSIISELEMLKEERKKIEAHEAEVRSGVSFYGSYFSN